MARKDVLLYFSQIENQYFEMLGDVKDYEAAYKNGEIDEERYTQAMSLIDTIKQNYERIAYIVFLLNAPNRDEKKAKYKKSNKKLVGALYNSSDYAIFNENADALKQLKQLLKGN